jgi:hypothetical protein
MTSHAFDYPYFWRARGLQYHWLRLVANVASDQTSAHGPGGAARSPNLWKFMAFVALAEDRRARRRRPYFFLRPVRDPRPIVIVRELLLDFACRSDCPQAAI